MADSNYAGARNGSIYIVSSAPIMTSDAATRIVEVPPAYRTLPRDEIITRFRVDASGTLRERRRSVPAQELRVAFVGNWNMRCGIATYSESLVPEVARRVAELRLFTERHEVPVRYGDDAAMGLPMLPCWRRGEELGELVAAIRDYDPDVVWLQHEFGIWPNARRWLSLMSQLASYRTIVTMHSVFHHPDKAVVEAAMPEIIVHLDGARKVLLEEKGIPSIVHVLPHGCASIDERGPLWNMYRSDCTFMQFGFGFRYKGWEQSLLALEILRRDHPDAFFTGLFSESPYNAADHQVYYDELVDMVNKLGLQENVALLRGYQTDLTLDAYLRTNRAVIFPYVSHPEHEVFGVSGAARLAMSKQVPVVTTNVNHFSDVPTLKGDDPRALAAALERVLVDEGARRAQLERQRAYVLDNSWARLAERHVEIFER